MSTPMSRQRKVREPDPDHAIKPDHTPPAAPPTGAVPVTGLLGPRPVGMIVGSPTPRQAGLGGQPVDASGSPTTIRRMAFTRTQLADSSKVDTIAAVAKQTGVIDTTRLTAQDRLDLLRVLKSDSKFSANHLEQLRELANEVRTDLGRPTQSSAVLEPPERSAGGTVVDQTPGSPGTQAVSPSAGGRPASPTASQSRPVPTAITYVSVEVTDSKETFGSQAESDKKWKERAASAGMTTKTVVGVYAEATHLSLEFALYRYTMAERRGTECRLLLPVRMGPAFPKLPVVLRWDTSGAASVRLVSEQAPRLPVTHEPAAMAKYLAGKGVTVADLGAWTAAQLWEFVVAVKLIDRLDPDAVGALHGILLEYTTKADTSSSNPQEAVFSWHPQNKTKPSFLVRKQAFVEDTKQFVGSEEGKLHCHSTMTIAHELGHAVEDHLYRRVSSEQTKASEAQAAAYEEYRLAKNSYQDAAQEANQDIADQQGVAARSRAAALANALADLYEVAEKAINAAVEGFDNVTDRGQHPTLPTTDIDNAKKLLVDAPQLVAAEAKKHTNLALPWQPLLEAMVKGRNRLLPLLDALNAAAASHRKMNAALERVVYSPGDGQVRSKRLQNFIEFVERLTPQAQERVVGITSYAEQQWPANPRELFAEAYALWLTDKPFLTGTAPEFMAYFNKGLHLK